MNAHGIMFHHFHNKKHIKCQGSISSNDLENLIDYYSKTHNILPACDFYQKAISNRLDSHDVSLAFDDGLLCQYEIAYPVLKKRRLTAFWFIYTLPLCGSVDRLEVYHHFRFSMFKSVDDFYDSFLETGKEQNNIEKAFFSEEAYNYKIYEEYYTENDRRFRYVRDIILTKTQYYNIMDKMMNEKNYDINAASSTLWMNREQIYNVSASGNIIGLHSHSHPTVMANQNYKSQLNEYQTNKQMLEGITRQPISTAAYPCNSYNENSIRVLKELGVKMAFRANMGDVCYLDRLFELPRADHAMIIAKMRGSISKL